MGGGTCQRPGGRASERGPSPRGRGNRRRGGGGRDRGGTIPAWAGEPPGPRSCHPPPGDHPRVGGGTAQVVSQEPESEGPSPRGRGNLVVIADIRGLLGTIPAWAGEPESRARRSAAKGDHPRVGGGTQAIDIARQVGLGPSPRGRGNPRRPVPVKRVFGTIPAWAGEPPCPAASSVAPRDHPRVGGGTPCCQEVEKTDYPVSRCL